MDNLTVGISDLYKVIQCLEIHIMELKTYVKSYKLIKWSLRKGRFMRKNLNQHF